MSAIAAGNPPTILGYRILGFAGRGAFGTVWFAEECVTGSPRAIKVIAKAAGDDGFDSRREIEGVRHYQESASDHASLVQIYHVGETEDACYYVMELADDANQSLERERRDKSPITATHRQPGAGASGSDCPYRPLTLTALMKSQGRLAPAEALGITSDVLRGLGHLHGQGCVHRDVKPSSVVFVGGRAKLADVGLVTDMDHTITRAGTPGYLPPDEALDHTADLYAVGIMLYEMITGLHRSRFPELPVFQRLPRREQRELSAAIEIANRAAHTDKRQRYRSAGDFLKDVARRHSVQLMQHRRVFAIVATLAMAASIALWFWSPAASVRLVDVRLDDEGPEPHVLALRYGDGRSKLHDFKSGIAKPLPVDFGGNGNPIIVVGFRVQAVAGRGLVAFDPIAFHGAGQVDYSHEEELSDPIPSAWDHQVFHPGQSAVIPLLAEDLDGIPGAELVVAVTYSEGPSHLLVYTRNWRRLTEYWHYGTLYAATACDLNGDGRKELICWGIGNRRDDSRPIEPQTEDYHVAILVIDPLGAAGSEGHWSRNEWMNKRSAIPPLAYGYAANPHIDRESDWAADVGLSCDAPPSIRVSFMNGVLLYLDSELTPAHVRIEHGARFQGPQPAPKDIWMGGRPTEIR